MTPSPRNGSYMNLLWKFYSFLGLDTIISGSLMTSQENVSSHWNYRQSSVKANIATMWPCKHTAHSTLAKKVRGWSRANPQHHRKTCLVPFWNFSVSAQTPSGKGKSFPNVPPRTTFKLLICHLTKYKITSFHFQAGTAGFSHLKKKKSPMKEGEEKGKLQNTFQLDPLKRLSKIIYLLTK